MKRAKKGRPSDCSTRTAVETGRAYRQNHTSNLDFNTHGSAGQIQIAEFLLRGQKNALPLRHLKEMTVLPGRGLRRQIEATRLAGAPILSDEHGYFLAGNQHEVARFVSSMRRRAKRIQAVAAAVEEANV